MEPLRYRQEDSDMVLYGYRQVMKPDVLMWRQLKILLTILVALWMIAKISHFITSLAK